MTKTRLIFLITLLLAAVFVLNAQQGTRHDTRHDTRHGTQQGGFIGPGANVTTVAEALTLRDDSPVIMRGRIERFLGNEKYLFTDETASIIIEVDNRVWRGTTVDENDIVEISGEIDRSFRRVEVDVSSLRKM